jgi:hypothetical protein
MISLPAGQGSLPESLGGVGADDGEPAAGPECGAVFVYLRVMVTAGAPAANVHTSPALFKTAGMIAQSQASMRASVGADRTGPAQVRRLVVELPVQVFVGGGDQQVRLFPVHPRQAAAVLRPPTQLGQCVRPALSRRAWIARLGSLGLVISVLVDQ